MRLNVITGGPGVGKTTLINTLAQQGYTCLPEAARMLIEGGLDPLAEDFQRKVLAKHLEQENQRATFADRGIIDSLAYCNHHRIKLPDNFPQDAENRYARVFILDPLPFYVNDSARRESKEEGMVIHRHIIDAYKSFGYDPIFVPVTKTIEQRADFVLKELHTERERKFIIYESGVWHCNPLTLKQGVFIRQGYLPNHNSEFDQIRVRQEGKLYLLTRKKGHGPQRLELEEEIDSSNFEHLWSKTEGRRIYKERFAYKGFEVDRYIDRDLIIAEAEARTISIGKEVTNDERYSNINLAH